MKIICQEDQERYDKARADIQEAIAAALGPEALQKVAEAVLDVLPDPDETDRLAFALHRLQAHPDFEYTTTTATARVYSVKRPDVDEGWELNTSVATDGVTRDEHTETWHWFRSIEYKRAQEAAEREEALLMARNLRAVGGMLRTWKDGANELVDRERVGYDTPVGVGPHKLWHRIITNALGGPELPARLGPLFALQLNAVFGIAVDELERHPEKRHD